jgi:hypothetical protein
MKTSLLVLCLIATAASSVLGETYRAPIERTRQKTQRVRPAPPVTRRDVDGVIPRGVRGGNFLQMFNPKAPAKYGTSQEAICFNPSPMHATPGQNGQTDPGKWKGIKFFVFQF